MRQTKDIWRDLVAYANETNDEAVESLAEALRKCIPWTVWASEWGLVPDMIRGFIHSPTGEFGKRFREQAVRYQPDIRRLLSWLCDPKGTERAAPFDFLREHSEHIRFTFDEVDLAGESGRVLRPFWKCPMVFHRMLHYEDIADPICDFVLNEHERYHEDKRAHFVPIRLCGRAACPNLATEKFCSDSCRALNGQEKRPASQNNDSVFVCRAKKLRGGALRAYLLEDPARKDRLERIARHYRNRKPSIAADARLLLHTARGPARRHYARAVPLYCGQKG